MLQDDGASVLAFPTIDIQLLRDAGCRLQLPRTRLPAYDILLFVSRNAVEGGFQHMIDVHAVVRRQPPSA